MKKIYIFTIILSFLWFPLVAQISHGGKPYSFDNAQKISSSIPEVVMPFVDVGQLMLEDSIEEALGFPWRFGKDIDVDYNLENSGAWETLENGDRLWRLKISSQGALSLNIVYSYFHMPENGKFFLYDDQKVSVLGSFSEKNNKDNNMFATMPTFGESTILEYYEPKEVAGFGSISISKVIHGYKNIFNYSAKAFGQSRPCEVDVGGLAGVTKHGVALILAANNNRLCSGSLINNLNNDGTPLLLTANHCNVTNNPNGPNSWIYMFGYESPAPGLNGPTNMTLSNSTIKANGAISDFLIVELSEQPPLAWGVYYNGWDAQAIPRDWAFCVHHPSGDVKKYSEEEHPYIFNGNFWKVPHWETGTTEKGSSGSPLFNPDGHIVGQLYGGNGHDLNVPCINTFSTFGRIDISWLNGLQAVLDPGNIGALICPGLDPIAAGNPPIAYVGSSNLKVNTNFAIELLDLSIYNPTAWTWNIIPNTFVWEVGFNQNSQNPKLRFTAEGVYTVQLNAANVNGNDNSDPLIIDVNDNYNVWLGQNNNWNNMINWSKGAPPIPNDHVIIPDIDPDPSPSLLDPTLNVNSNIDAMDINTGAWLFIGNGFTLTSGGNVGNNGAIVILNGGAIVSNGPFSTNCRLEVQGDMLSSNNFTNSGSGYLYIPAGGTFTANGLFTNNGIFKITSNNTGSAGSFIDNAGLAGTGTYQFNRFLTSSSYDTIGWHYVSSPVNNTVTGDFVGYWVKEYLPNGHNPVPGVTHYFNDIDPFGPNPCDPCDWSRLNDPINVMQGYSVKQDLSYPSYCPWMITETGDVIEFGGDNLDTHPGNGPYGCVPATVPSPTAIATMANVNTGPYNINVTWNGIIGNPVVGPFHEWNLIGNPYSAPISCGAFTADFPLQINQSIYYWDNENSNYAVWAGGVGADFIPATQGFMVEVNTPGNWVVNVINGYRTHSGADKFYKSNISDLLTIQASGNGYTDKTHIRFLDEASEAFDRTWDAHKLISAAAMVPQVYTKAGREQMAINALPSTELVPMSFRVGTNGVYTLEAIETSAFTKALLLDKEVGVITDLLDDTYSFNYKAGDNPDRFIIHFSDISAENESNGLLIYSNQSNIIVYNTDNQQGDVNIYNVVGQIITTQQLEDGINNITLNNAYGYYIVNVRTSENVVNKKVYIK